MKVTNTRVKFLSSWPSLWAKLGIGTGLPNTRAALVQVAKIAQDLEDILQRCIQNNAGCISGLVESVEPDSPREDDVDGQEDHVY